MAVSKATRSRARKKAVPYQRVINFQQAKGKVIAEVELSVSPDYYIIDIGFQDKTALSFEIEPCIQAFPKLTSWKTGNSKSLKRWRPVHSRSSRVF
ncbi:MAG: hypothetical protein WA672_15740 [Candidatus Angelobacter sp.]